MLTQDVARIERARDAMHDDDYAELLAQVLNDSTSGSVGARRIA